MKKMDKETDAREFLQVILKRDPTRSTCLDCPHPNGECVEFARKGKCKAYN